MVLADTTFVALLMMAFTFLFLIWNERQLQHELLGDLDTELAIMEMACRCSDGDHHLAPLTAAQPGEE